MAAEPDWPAVRRLIADICRRRQIKPDRTIALPDLRQALEASGMAQAEGMRCIMHATMQGWLAFDSQPGHLKLTALAFDDGQGARP
jgi:hypothetical protein